LGLSVEQTEKRLRLLERFVTVLPEPAGLYKQWRGLVLSHGVMGVQVHDAKIAAAMSLHAISQILTLNSADFTRYKFVIPISPIA
jgi:predicted nucleic acid-binding protein